MRRGVAIDTSLTKHSFDKCSVLLAASILKPEIFATRLFLTSLMKLIIKIITFIVVFEEKQ